jgi:hypothetical protein
LSFHVVTLRHPPYVKRIIKTDDRFDRNFELDFEGV